MNYEKLFFNSYCYIACIRVLFFVQKERVTAGSVNEVYEFQSVDSTWKLLTLREKIGQTMLMLPDRKKELDLGDGSLDVYFKRYPVTGYFMGWKLFTGVPEEERVDFVRSSVEEYQKSIRASFIVSTGL